MSVIQAKIKVLQKFQGEVDKIVIQQLRPFESEILDLNVQEQLRMRGEDSEGNKLQEYTATTKAIKRAKGQITSHVTLEDTGDFHASFFVNFGPRYFAIGALDEKAEKLERKYGKAIYGLNNQGLQEVIDLAKDPLITEFRKAVL